MLKKSMSIILLSAMFLFVLTACGQSREDVIDDLSKKMDRLSGYTTKATMTFKHGDKQQKYQAEIWYKKPNFYKVVLKDEHGQNPQMIIRNKDGVYLLTPALNKKYHFESDWPKNRSQYYLYESLVKDIVQDGTSKFETKEDAFIFTTKTHYPTKMLAYQKISLKKKNLAPLGVKVMDKDMNVIIDVVFKGFNFKPKFDSDAFDVDKNELSMKLDNNLPAMASLNQPFEILKPTIQLKNTKIAYTQDVNEDGQRKFVLKYTGDKAFTLIESKSDVAKETMTVTMDADPVDLGFTFGIMTDHSLSWSNNGMDFYLVSDKLTTDEMKDVAQSVVGMVNK
ncbi:MAG: LolA family protein [Tuberibacillus sp.]